MKWLGIGSLILGMFGAYLIFEGPKFSKEENENETQKNKREVTEMLLT